MWDCSRTRCWRSITTRAAPTDESRGGYQFGDRPEGRDECGECDPGTGGTERRGVARAVLRSKNLRLPMLGNDDATANREYMKQIVLEHDAVLGKKYGVKYAEGFHYIAPERSRLDEIHQEERSSSFQVNSR